MRIDTGEGAYPPLDTVLGAFRGDGAFSVEVAAELLGVEPNAIRESLAEHAGRGTIEPEGDGYRTRWELHDVNEFT